VIIQNIKEHILLFRAWEGVMVEGKSLGVKTVVLGERSLSENVECVVMCYFG